MKKLASVFLMVFLALPSQSFASADEAKKCESLEFSRSFLGILKKSMRFETKVSELANRYGIDEDVIIAIMMYESGGNEGLVSSAGARGLMQIMPSTFKWMTELYGVNDEFEAAIRYLKYLYDKFGDNLDSVVAAYNGGPSRATRQEVKYESFQYLMGVSQFYTLLKNYKPCLQEKMKDLEITEAVAGNSWQTLRQKTGVSELELRMYNPFWAQRGIRAKSAVVYPKKPSGKLIEKKDTENGTRFRYKVRLGDIYHYLANIFGLSYEDFRKLNHLFFYGHIYPGMRMEVTGSAHLKKN